MISTLYNGETTEGLSSSSRILISTLFWPVVLGKRKAKSLVKLVFIAGFINSFLACLQFYDAVVSPFLPKNLLYGNLWGFESIEPFRNGGFLNGVQASSILAFLSISIGLVFNYRYSIVWFTVNYFAIFTGSRTLLILATVLVAYFIYKNFLKSVVIVYVLVATLPNIQGFDNYFNDRIVTAFKVFISLDASEDYSSKDTMTHYRSPTSFRELIFGNGHARYSDMGGKDPFFSRWLLQSGLFSSACLILMLFLIFKELYRIYPLASVVVFIIWMLTSVKGELFTAFGVFDLLVIGVFVIAPGFNLYKVVDEHA